MGFDADDASFSVACSRFILKCTPRGLPSIYDALKDHAAVVDEHRLHERGICCLTVRRSGESWPFLVVAQSYAPSGGGFDPGALLVTETGVLFVGAGERVLAYRLDPLERLWEDTADTGFLAWDQHGDVVLLSAELEFAAWTTSGAKLWTTFVEPPWGYAIRDESVELDVMGTKSTFGLHAGPARARG